MSDDEDYGFEYSEDDEEEEDVNIENQYYNSKGLRDTDEDAAVAGFKEVATMESDKGARSHDRAAAAGPRPRLVGERRPRLLQASGASRRTR